LAELEGLSLFDEIGAPEPLPLISKDLCYKIDVKPASEYFERDTQRLYDEIFKVPTQGKLHQFKVTAIEDHYTAGGHVRRWLWVRDL
jgi:hypothetical protein